MGWGSTSGWSGEGWGGAAAPAGGGSFTTLDPANTGTGASTGAGNLVFTSASNPSQTSSRSIASFSTGKKKFEVLVSAGSLGGVCLCDSSWALTGASSYVGGPHSAGFEFGGGVGGGVDNTGDPVSIPETWSFECDATVTPPQLFLVTPRGRYGPLSATAPGAGLITAPYFFGVSSYDTAANWTVNFGAASFVRTNGGGFVGI